MTNPYSPPQAVVRDIAHLSALGTPADRGTRLGAAILDSIIFMAMVYLPAILAVLAGGAATRAQSDAGSIGMVAGGVVALAGFGVWCWLTIMYMVRNGQSIAKKLLSIKVVRTDGSAISLSRLIWLRNVVNGLIGIIPVYGLLDVLFIFGESRQCLHDKLAGTIVIKA